MWWGAIFVSKNLFLSRVRSHHKILTYWVINDSVHYWLGSFLTPWLKHQLKSGYIDPSKSKVLETVFLSHLNEFYFLLFWRQLEVGCDCKKTVVTEGITLLVFLSLGQSKVREAEIQSRELIQCTQRALILWFNWLRYWKTNKTSIWSNLEEG